MITISGEGLSIYDVEKIAARGAPVSLDAAKLQAVKRSYDRVQEWGAAKYPIYGVNTGFGELVHMIVPPQFKSDLQHNLLRSHAAGIGETFPDEIVRAIMTARLNCLMKGYSGVSPQSLELLQHFLNRHIHPIVPRQGSLGASGDLSPLSHMALPLIGDGLVRIAGAVRRASEVLEEQGLQPVTAGFKEALALVNGTSGMTGAACMALVRAYKLLKLALLASADFLQCLGGSSRAFDHRGHALKNHYGQSAVARVLRKLIAGSDLVREHQDLMKALSLEAAEQNEVRDSKIFLQNAYSLRCIPQILGPVLDTLNFCRKLTEEELNSCNDNPLIFETPEETFHGGHFHGQYVAMTCDFLNIAIAEIGVLAERQLNRLLDPHLNGSLPAFLADGQTGLFCGYEGAQYLATSIASENLDIAAPASIKTIPTNGQNQDVVSLGLIAARKSLQLCDNVAAILSVLVAGCCQASYFIGPEKFNSPIREFHLELSAIVPKYRDEFPISQILDEVARFVTSEKACSYLDEQIDFDEQNPNV